LLLCAAPLGAQLTVQLTSLPAGTSAAATIFIAGDFNRWHPAAPGFQLKQQSGSYTITLPDSVRGSIEFKFTLGSWETVETSSSGGDVANRTFTVPATGAATYTATVASWKESKAAAAPRKPTASASVAIMSADFNMPQLSRTRRVWIYLPPDYATSRRAYPVLYMHDGQNIFDAATSYAGEWGVDETLDSLKARGDAGVIVVAVDHGGAKRFDEYSPWQNQRYGGGEGDAYVDFIVQTLKPYIDRHYRTRTDAANTAIAGSSMGGLISLYAALKYPDVFSKAGVFSPSVWVAPAIATYAREHAAALNQAKRPRLYFVSATSEAQLKAQLAVSEPLMAALAAAGYQSGSDLVVLLRPDGAHSEWFWRREFPAAYHWLFDR
jgi:metallo-beta-lactamase class B